MDADISLENRVVSIAAEGVEFAVATDHYVVTDFAPSCVSSRISVRVRARRDDDRDGDQHARRSVSATSTSSRSSSARTWKYRDVTPSELFADARQKSPGGVLQVNHPRWDESSATSRATA